MLIERLREVGSTSDYLRAEMPDAPHGTVVSAHTQTAGRGQRGNSWEAEPGMNLTFSILLRPSGIEAREQYSLSEAVATAIASTLRKLLPEPQPLTIKWPNDIYYADSKLAGILIENSLSGSSISKAIAGIGININQSLFNSDAPNPISLRQITGRSYDTDQLLEEIAGAVIAAVDTLPAEAAQIHERYLSMLWRRQGFHPYKEPDGERFVASIASIAPTGHLTLRRPDGSEKTYAFKEVIALIE
ncbi:MAG: biotin--[acetyl-CoA-carboxylase] ligase [Bacteroidales bacterium]|nr:biotin--[acetyl-CoA-carboxylase] ligase [Bacteroidales bacterium]